MIDDRRLLDSRRGCDREGIVALVERFGCEVVAIDSPRSCASPGEKTRPGELRLNREVCGIRWTPDEDEVRGNPYYGWVVEGLALYQALAHAPAAVIEVFPTASWTRWCGGRAGRRRSEWSREGLATLGLRGLPGRTSQDLRDAIAAAVTARQYSRGQTEDYGEIVVPVGQPGVQRS